MASIIVKNGLTVVTFMVLARLIEPAAFGSISITLMAWGLAIHSSTPGSRASWCVNRSQAGSCSHRFTGGMWASVPVAAGALALAGPAGIAFLSRSPSCAPSPHCVAVALFPVARAAVHRRAPAADGVQDHCLH
jgi:hypothetical protein